MLEQAGWLGILLIVAVGLVLYWYFRKAKRPEHPQRSASNPLQREKVYRILTEYFAGLHGMARHNSLQYYARQLAVSDPLKYGKSERTSMEKKTILQMGMSMDEAALALEIMEDLLQEIASSSKTAIPQGKHPGAQGILEQYYELQGQKEALEELQALTTDTKRWENYFEKLINKQQALFSNIENMDS